MGLQALWPFDVRHSRILERAVEDAGSYYHSMCFLPRMSHIIAHAMREFLHVEYLLS